jgi:hypothetical protein
MEQIEVTSIQNDVVTKRPNLVRIGGIYRIFEYQGIGSERKLVTLPLEARVTFRSDFIGVEVHDETNGKVTKLDYPMNGGSYWNEELKTFTFCRAAENTYVADTIYIPNGNRNARTTFRATWVVDQQGQIHETFEEFDADGKRLDLSPGYLRILVPVQKVNI